jgi:COMPASS component SWD2
VKYLSCESIQFQGPFDTFLVGGDTAEVSDIKFSNDGKSMLLTTTNNHIYVLDAYGGDKLSYIIFPFSLLQIPILVVHIFGSYIFLLISQCNLQRCGFSLEPSPNVTNEAAFTPDGQYIISGNCIFWFIWKIAL